MAEPHTAIAACQAAEQTKPNKEPPAHESAPGPAADLSGTLLLDVRHEGSACDKPSYSAPQLLVTSDQNTESLRQLAREDQVASLAQSHTHYWPWQHRLLQTTT